MSLDNIKLPPLAIQHLYEKTLVSKPGQVKIPDPELKVLNFLGGNNLNIIMVVNSAEAAYIDNTQLNFLTDILNACKLNMNDIAVINYYQNNGLTYKRLATELNAKIVFLFDVAPQKIDLPFSIPEFQIQSFNNQKYISVPALDTLQKEVELKKKLWTSLKQIFL